MTSLAPMFSLPGMTAGALLTALTLYFLSGGADFGGGVWDLLSTGARKTAQRKLITQALEPIWEANHVWLVLIIVGLWTGFPLAFAHITTLLHVPLLIMLLGIVLRGTAFSFSTQGVLSARAAKLATHLFAISSTIVPALLGIVLGAVASGRLPQQPQRAADFFTPWLGLFPLWIGFFALALAAYLSAVYLTVEAEGDLALQNDFRLRALVAGAVGAVGAAGGYLSAKRDAPVLWTGLIRHWWSWPPQIAAILLGLLAFVMLWQRRFHFARACAIAQVALVIWGWGLAQFPYLVVAHLTVFDSGAVASTLRYLLVSLVVGALILFPSFGGLYWLFKGRRLRA
ncbi:MAG TPA: cytochrome d ubiquinol oxidase subunit II [Candidatus Binataceae bacterium]|nr:cytochrome d ubiquinol oxidase subunit II [Candidatus Binataceae bacterium]